MSEFHKNIHLKSEIVILHKYLKTILFVTISPDGAQNSLMNPSFPCSGTSPSIPGFWPPCVRQSTRNSIVLKTFLKLDTGYLSATETHNTVVIVALLGFVNQSINQ